MKKHLFLCLITLVSANAIAAEVKDGKAGADDVFGHTFFTIRPEFLSAHPEKTTMFRDRALARCDGNGGAIQFVPFGGKSTKSKDLMKYFAPCPKTELVVDSNGDNLLRDIDPLFFGIQLANEESNYQSTIAWRPERTVGGIGITYRQYLGRDCDPACRKWWLEISGPILHVRNKVKLEETNRVVTGTLSDVSNENMLEAFKGETNILTTGTSFSFGRINDESKTGMSKTGAVIELKIGYDYYDDECVSIGGYFGLHIPASKKGNGVQMFEAIPGFNQHFGFMTGFLAGAEIWRDCDRSLSLEVETNHRYFIQNTQTRSFDLKGRKWSRYMFIADKEQPINEGEFQGFAVEPAINVLTRKMKVHPRYSFDINSGFVYDNDCGFRGEIGYNFYVRQSERVRLKEEWDNNRYAVAGLSGFVDINDRLATNQANLISNIADLAQNEDMDITDDNVTIRGEQLGLESALHPCVMTNLIYGSLGYHWDDRCYPLFVGLGGSYEISGRNTGLNRWLVWGKFGVSL